MNGELPRCVFRDETGNKLSVCQLRKSDGARRHSEQSIFERHIDLSSPRGIDQYEQTSARPQDLADAGKAGQRDQVFHENKYWDVCRGA